MSKSGYTPVKPQPIAWRVDDPLLRVEGEPQRANDALQIFALDGPCRSIPKVSRKLGHGHHTTVSAWSIKYHWRARIAAWVELEDQRLHPRRTDMRLAALEDSYRRFDEIIALARECFLHSRRGANKPDAAAGTSNGNGSNGHHNGNGSNGHSGNGNGNPVKDSLDAAVATANTKPGDPRFLVVELKAIEDRRKMLGIDAPTELKHSGAIATDSRDAREVVLRAVERAYTLHGPEAAEALMRELLDDPNARRLIETTAETTEPPDAPEPG